MKKKWIILDRDGVINYDSDEYIKSPDEWTPIPGSLEAIAALNWAGYYVVVATNQSGVNRGLYDRDTLMLIHKKMQSALIEAGGHFEGIFYCPHTPDEKCSCRKPNVGLFNSIIEEYKINLTGVLAIGDKLSDIQAARAVGCKPILVRTGRGAETLNNHKGSADLIDVPVYDDLAAAVTAILANKN